MFVRLSKNLAGAATVGEVLQEIAKICTGAITNRLQLQVFDSATSLIINDISSNWTLYYPASFSASTNSYIFRSECVTTGKYKYARLVAKGTATNESFVEPSGGTANVYQKAASLAYYIELASCSDASSTTGAVTNSTYFHQGAEGWRITNNDLYLSISSRHMLMYSEYNATTNLVNVFSIFEYPENNVTIGKNLIPVITYRGNGSALVASTVSLDTTAATAKNVSQIPDGYNITTAVSNILLSADNTSPNLSSFDFNLSWTGSQNLDYRLALGTIDRQIFIKDFLFFDASRNMGFSNATFLSDVGFYAVGEVSPLDFTYVKNNKTYVSLHMSKNSNAIIVPRH